MTAATAPARKLLVTNNQSEVTVEVVHDGTALVSLLLDAGDAIRSRFAQLRNDSESRFQNAPPSIRGRITFGPLGNDAFDVEMLGVTVAFRLHLRVEQADMKGVVTCIRAPRHPGEEPAKVGEFTFERNGSTNLTRGGQTPGAVSLHDQTAPIEFPYSALLAALKAP